MKYETGSHLIVCYTDGGERIYERDGYFPTRGDTFEENVIKVYYATKSIVKDYPELKEFWMESRTEIAGEKGFIWFIEGTYAPTQKEPKNMTLQFGSDGAEEMNRPLFADVRRYWLDAHNHPNPLNEN